MNSMIIDSADPDFYHNIPDDPEAARWFVALLDERWYHAGDRLRRERAQHAITRYQADELARAMPPALLADVARRIFPRRPAR